MTQPQERERRPDAALEALAEALWDALPDPVSMRFLSSLTVADPDGRNKYATAILTALSESGWHLTRDDTCPASSTFGPCILRYPHGGSHIDAEHTTFSWQTNAFRLREQK